jgi:CBS domain-containing protein
MISNRREMMKVSECMTTGVQVVNPQETIAEAARMMESNEVGFMPVGENGRLVGTLTDRDMVVRGLAHNRGPETQVREVMTSEVLYCFDDEDLDDAAAKMSDNQVRRLPVLNREKKLIGVITLGDIAQATDDDGVRSGETLGNVTEAGGKHAH